MHGYVTGGWEFVEAAYTFTATMLIGYLCSVVLRLREQARLNRAAAEEARAEAAEAAEPAGMAP